MMRDVTFLKSLIPYCLYHHERWDGKGYPQRLKGNDIPIEGRIIAVADTFDAMTSKRPYRDVMETEKAIAEIERCRGSQFDPLCVDAFLNCYRKGRITRLLKDYYAGDEMSIACVFCSTYVKLPDGIKSGDIIECSVCRRRMKILGEKDRWQGELVPESEIVNELFSILSG